MLGELACDVGVFAWAGAAVVRASEAPTAATSDASRLRQVRRVEEFSVLPFFDCSSIALGPARSPTLTTFDTLLIKQSQEGSSPMVHGLRIKHSMYRLFWTGMPLAACIILTVAVCLAATLTGRVVGISDGDTITVMISGRQQAVIRLAGIDAPEHGQAFASASEEHLRALIVGKDVNLDCGGEESYGRLVCKVLLPGGEDVSLDQVKAGMAWQYKQYESAQRPDDRAKYAAAEDVARETHLGLWADAHPVQPQDFRHGTLSPLCFDKSDHRIACSEQYHGPVRGNVRSHIYHWPSCPNYDDISEGNRVEFPSAAAAEQAGYRAARNCP